eukprot:12224813-Alexandrium_andersonii.AAC.1
MADPAVSASAWALANWLGELLKPRQPNATLGKHLPGLPIYGSLGANLADFLLHAVANGPPLGDVSAELVVQAVAEQGRRVNFV